jgi:hypothetical protein
MVPDLRAEGRYSAEAARRQRSLDHYEFAVAYQLILLSNRPRLICITDSCPGDLSHRQRDPDPNQIPSVFVACSHSEYQLRSDANLLC